MITGFKGERGYSAYEVAVRNGFVGSEKTWLAQLGTSTGAKQESITYVTKSEEEKTFNLPESYNSNSILDVYVDGVKMSTENYTVSDTSLTFNTPIQKTGARVEITVTTMSITNLPLVEEINESSTNNTAVGAKTIFELKKELEDLIGKANDLIEKKVPKGGKEGQVLAKKSGDDDDTEWVELDWLNKTYPIGSIYMNVDNKNPNDLFGGKWERLPDRFLLGAGNTYVAGKTGGEPTNTHNHFSLTSFDGKNFYSTVTDSDQKKTRTVMKKHAIIVPTEINEKIQTREDATYDETISIMPPYLVVYMWKRTA